VESRRVDFVTEWPRVGGEGMLTRHDQGSQILVADKALMALSPAGENELHADVVKCLVVRDVSVADFLDVES
jgi:hypothetical protein